jgi:hypothetical protein
MAVYSYTSSATLNITDGYDGDLLGSYPGYFVSTYSEEKTSFDYNKDSIVTYDVWDYGSISDAITEDEDYGEITATIELWYQIQDYGTLEVNTTRSPYGEINFGDFADSRLIRVSVGGVQFALFGRAATEVIFNPVNRVFDIEGAATVRATLASAGNGIVNFPRVKATDSVGFSSPESVFLLKIQGSAVTYPVFYEGDRVFDIEGTADESITYDYNDSSKLDLNSDDYGFITEALSRTEDFGLITEGQDIQRWDSEAEDWGLITEDITVNLYGKFKLFGKGEESFIFANYDGSWGNKQPRLLGTAKDYSTPKINGSGKITLEGTPRVQIRMHYKADGGWDRYPDRFRGGSLFGFSSATQTSTFTESPTGKLFSVQSTTTFSAVRDEVGISDEDILVRGNANYIVIFNEVDRVLTFSNIEDNSRVYSYNETSIVNVEGIDYGFVSESPTLFEDYQNITGDAYYPWEIDDYGFLTPDRPLFPYGVARIISTTADSQTKIYIGDGLTSINGNAKVYVLPKHNGSGFIRIAGELIEKNTENYVGSGSLFGFSSTSESTAVVEESKELFKFIGNAVEKNTENYVGSGLFSTLGGSAESYGPNPEEQGELFTFSGSAVERNAESYVGSGSLFSISGHAERVTYHYNESSIVDIESYDYGFITETPLFESSCDTISDYSSELISTYADEIVSEFGCVDVGDDYGLVGDQTIYPWQRDDYGFIIPDAPRRPYGKFEFISGTTDAQTKVYIGSGSLFGFSSTTEATVVQAESKGLFRISGNAAESTTPATEIGSGSIFTFVSFTETATYNPPESTELFKISGEAYVLIAPDYPGSGTITVSGEARIYVLPKHNGSGFVHIFGNAAESTTPATEIGSGSIFTFVSFTETAVFNPAESTELFKITGSAVEKSSPGPDGSGTIELNGSATTIFRLKVTETGREPIKVTGNATESTTPATEIGSGSLFGFSSTTESTSNAETSRELFRFSGTAVEKNTENYVGSGNVNIEGSATTIFRLRVTETGREPIRITGNVIEKNTESYLGSGSLFGFSSTTESTSNAETSKELFKFSGTATELVSYNPPEVGEFIKLSGTAVERNTESYLGTGSLFGFSGASESISNAETSKELFRFSGKGQESTTPAPHIGSGSIFTFVSFTESTSVSEVSTELFRFSGTAEEKNTESYIGTGSLFGFSSTTEASGSNPPESTILFRFAGKGEESTTPAPHVGSGSIFTFVSFTETRTVSEVSTELFRFSGTAEEKNTEAYKGTGLITSIGSKSTTIFRVRVISDGSLLRINGNLREAFAYGLYNGYDEIQISGESRDRKIKAEPKKPPRIYVI